MSQPRPFTYARLYMPNGNKYLVKGRIEQYAEMMELLHAQGLDIWNQIVFRSEGDFLMASMCEHYAASSFARFQERYPTAKRLSIKAFIKLFKEENS